MKETPDRMTKGAAYSPPFQINTVTSRNGATVEPMRAFFRVILKADVLAAIALLSSGPCDSSHFGDTGTTNSGMSLTFDLTEFEMKHCASALSMISRACSSSASLPTVI